MTAFDVLERYGTNALLRFTAAVVLFLVLHMLRIPLVLVARVLEGVMCRLNAYAATQASRPPAGPINHFFADDHPGRETRHA